MKAVIYARFSSDMQDDRSIEDQVALCRDFARRKGFEVVSVQMDRAMSGASVHGRTGFEQLVAVAKSGQVDTIIAEDIDRLSRNQADMARLYERMTFSGIEIWTVADGLINEMHVGLKGTMSAMFLKNLALKTHRGLAGRVRAGKSAGGRSYGYRVAGTGERTIDETEAGVIRRIFAESLAGNSPRAIAARLNAEQIPGPRGGVWNASTINGSRKRATGILRNELYAGRIVWNRQHFAKDPDTGKRVSRPNEDSARQTVEVPDLVIVDERTWQKVQDRLATRGTPHERHRPVRPRHLLSGLCRCSTCGGPFTVTAPGKIGCSRRRETGLCDNRRLISIALIEDRIVEGIRAELLHPDAVARCIQEYYAQRKRLAATGADQARKRARRIDDIGRELQRYCDVIASGRFTEEMGDRMKALEGERTALRAKPDQGADVLALHPAAIDRYRDLAANLHERLAERDEAKRAETVRTIRDLIEKIVIWPRGDEGGKDIELYGTLAAILELPRRRAEGMVEVVAGTRYSHAHTPDAPSIVIPLQVGRRA